MPAATRCLAVISFFAPSAPSSDDVSGGAFQSANLKDRTKTRVST